MSKQRSFRDIAPVDRRKKRNKKARPQKLSIKIILSLFIILISILFVVSILFNIAQAMGLEPPEDELEVEAWLRLVMLAVSLTIGISIVALFSFVINKTIVARIRKLEDAAKEVAKGNLDINVEVKGRDELSGLADSFNKMSAELRANEYLNKEFIRNISHEYKTPISAIRAYGELLEIAADSGKIDAATVKEYAEIIIKESDRLTGLSSSVLQLSLLDSTTIIKKDDRFNPAEQVRDIFRLMQAKWAEKNLTLDLNLEEIVITSNERLLFQVWQNLISNAIKFSNYGGIIKVILTRNNEKSVYFEISDNGSGIKDVDKGKIFEHFYMADSSRSAEGSGLGLPIVKKILLKIGGEIGFDSTEGDGSKFFVRL